MLIIAWYNIYSAYIRMYQLINAPVIHMLVYITANNYYATHAGIFGLEDPLIVDNVTDITQSTCQVDFATINNVQPTLTNQPTLKDQLVDETVKSAVVLASVVGSTLGLCCITLICIVGLIVIRNKRRENKVKKGVFTRQLLPIMFHRYIAISVINIIHLIIGIDKEVPIKLCQTIPSSVLSYQRIEV